MLTRLAGFIYPHRRVVLYVTVVGAVIAGVFGSSVANHLSPYGANDPATQSVQATNRFQNATNREIDPGVVALVTVGNVHTATAQNRVDQVTAQLQHGPDVASAASYYAPTTRRWCPATAARHTWSPTFGRSPTPS